MSERNVVSLSLSCHRVSYHPHFVVDMSKEKVKLNLSSHPTFYIPKTISRCVKVRRGDSLESNGWYTYTKDCYLHDQTTNRTGQTQGKDEEFLSGQAVFVGKL